MKKRPPLVRVEWTDATSWHGWFKPGDVDADPKWLTQCETVGWLVKRDKTQMVVAQTRSAEPKYGELWSIPKRWIRRVEVLRSRG